ncbi:hypothetical protein CP533_2462 [Ophiocordyceps camponoti-saundersi (nom. inval.)]|nr:hypothetical protein CP533_2462 [Ophiocordyceps camponoti-saundersi (nom. inval.)]
MRTVFAILGSALIGVSLAQDAAQEAKDANYPANCPTVTSTQSICSTCIRPMCVMQKTISCPHGCHTPLPTVYKSYPCGHGCPGGCGTFYTYQGCAKPTAAAKL